MKSMHDYEAFMYQKKRKKNRRTSQEVLRDWLTNYLEKYIHDDYNRYSWERWCPQLTLDVEEG